MPIEVQVNGASLGYCHDRFYAVRIGSAPDNEIVLADSQVHPYHCTLVHTGSTYRIEAPRNHIVYLDGALVSEGAQFMLDRDSPKEGVTLTLGNAPGADGMNPPRTLNLRYVADADLRKNLLRRKRLNRENWQRPFNWLVVGVVALGAVFAGLWGKSFFDDIERDDRIREARVLFESGEPQLASLQTDLTAAMVRLGLANADGDFMPLGTGWLWDDRGTIRLVTNRHVRDQVFNCANAQAADAADCRGMQGACPAAHRYDRDNPDALPILLAGCNHNARVALIEPKVHPHYDDFEKQFPGNGRDDVEVPNIFDVALFDWPAGVAPWGKGLKLASPDRRAEIAQNVATVGFPLEGERAGGSLARTWTFRAASVGRLSDPFGAPGTEQHFLVLTGSEVQGGESGGPVIDEQGFVVGMLFGGYFTGSPGEKDLGRLSFGNKVRALDAELIRETASAPAANVAAQRKALWATGVKLLSETFERRLLLQQVADSCKAPDNISPDPIGQRKTVRANRPVGEVDLSKAFQPRFAGSETLVFERDTRFDTKVQQTFVVTVSSEAQDSPVLMQIRRAVGAGQRSRWISSNSALTSLASAKEDVQFIGSDAAQVEAVIYSEKETDYTLSVYRIACERK